MASDKKFSLLVAVALVTLAGQIVISLRGAPDIVRYMISDIGTTLIAILAAMIGFERARAFTFRSVLGKSIAFVSLGVLVWGFGEFMWLYYNVISGVEVPYPSLADAGFVGMIPLAAYGLYLLLKSVKIEFDAAAYLKMAVIPAAVFLSTYWLFIQTKLAENAPFMQKALNVLYPVGDAIFISFALVILGSIKGGSLHRPISIICIGFIVEALADFSFSWTSAAETYYVGGWVDALFALAFFIIGIGMHYMNVLPEIIAKKPRA